MSSQIDYAVTDMTDEASSAAAATRSRGRPPVPKERIVAAALKIVDEQGAEALSLRALAQQLDSSTATLYRHFANRADLVHHVIDHTLGNAPVDAKALQSLDWEQACRAMATWMFEALKRHPNVAPLLLDQAPAGPNTLALRELALQVFIDAGFSPSIALRSYATLARFVLGFAIQLNGEEGEDGALIAAYKDADPEVFPATAAVASLAPVPLDDEFRFGLDLLLTGLASLR